MDIRNVAYASKAYEAAEKNLIRILHAKGDILRYYNRAGRMKAVNVSPFPVTLPVKFYIAAYGIQNIEVIDESTGKAVEAQVSAHPRGALIKAAKKKHTGISRFLQQNRRSIAESPIWERNVYGIL